jgi:hypothetical protein
MPRLVNVDINTNDQDWTGSFTVSALTDVVRSTLPTSSSFTYAGNNISLTPAQFRAFPATNNSYITWRDNVTSSQYPTTGKSIDIWSDTLYNAVAVNDNTWNDLITNSGTTPYVLNADKWTLVYNYDVPYAAMWGKGGTIVFTDGGDV